MTREELHIQTSELIKTNKRIALQWCTGLGKSRASIEMANYIQSKGEGNIKILLVVAESAHKDNWAKEMLKWKLLSNDVTVECYASLPKYKETNWDLIIFDEAHHLGTDLKLDILQSIITEHVILLSATLPEILLQSLTRIFGEFKVSKVSLKQAIDEGMLPQPKVFLIPLKLDNTVANCTIVEEWGEEKKRVEYRCLFAQRWAFLRDKKKYPNVKLTIMCTALQKYNYLTEQFEYWKNRYMRTRQEFVKAKWLQAGSKRKRFLGDMKTNHVKVFLNKLSRKRYICFCSSIEQADYLGKDKSIHSKKNNSLDIINQFNNKEINRLFAVGMLQEGQNLEGIQAGVIVQLDNAERAFIQKFGRTIRADSPQQFIFYYENTRDIDYLENVFEGVDEAYISTIENLENFKLNG